MGTIALSSTSGGDAGLVIAKSKHKELFRDAIDMLVEEYFSLENSKKSVAIILYETKGKLSGLALWNHSKSYIGKAASEEDAIEALEDAIRKDIRGNLDFFEIGAVAHINDFQVNHLTKALTHHGVLINGNKDTFPANRWLLAINPQNVRFEAGRDWKELESINIVSDTKACLSSRKKLFSGKDAFRTLPSWDAVLGEVEEISKNFVINLQERKDIFESGVCPFPAFIAQELEDEWNPKFIWPKMFSARGDVAYTISDSPIRYESISNEFHVPDGHYHWAGWKNW